MTDNMQLAKPDPISAGEKSSHTSFAMPDPDGIRPSLIDARARIVRATEHIARLKAESAALANNKDLAVTFAAGATGAICDLAGIPPIIAILIGEAVHNLRAALDYLVYLLAILDDGQVHERTQFPIESTEEGWNKHVGRYLAGVSEFHKAHFKQLQPFNGVDWTAKLRDISNPDKHRQLTVGGHGPMVRVTANWVSGDQTVSAAADKPVDMHIENATYVVLFNDLAPVVETLKILQQEVSDVIDAFEPEFQ